LEWIKERRMANSCPNCNRDFGVVCEGQLNLKNVGRTLLDYRCPACNSHWTRPKGEIYPEDLIEQGVKTISPPENDFKEGVMI